MIYRLRRTHQNNPAEVEMKKGTILSGMRPTGKLHMGNYLTLRNWVKLQDEYECFFTIVDWHALTTGYEQTEELPENIKDMALDWLSAGIDPERSTVFVQSHVKQHAELHLLLSMITPLGWLERCPTYKEQLRQISDREIQTYGFLGYPVLQAADIAIYLADTVPVGQDQIPHLELAREIVRRFNFLYGQTFVEPEAILNNVPLLPGTDGRKMSKSYGNYIALSDDPVKVAGLISQMVTDPARIRKSDPGHPDICTVFAYYSAFAVSMTDQVRSECEGAQIGCVACKKRLAGIIAEIIEPIHERRRRFESDPRLVENILLEGSQKAGKVAEATMTKVRAAIRLI